LCKEISGPSGGMYGFVLHSEYNPHPSTLVELNAYSARAWETPCSTIESNCSSCPGRASCAVSVHEAAAKVKSSYFLAVEPGAVGMFNGSTNAPCSPVLPISRGGSMCGAGWVAASASVEMRL